MQAPKLPSIFKQLRASQFDFKPRYYNESKERIEKLRAKYERENKMTEEDKEALRKFDVDFSTNWRSNRQTSVNSSNRMLLLIIVALLFVTYYIISY